MSEWYSPNHRIPKRQPKPGFKQWELRNGDRVLVCEFRDDQRQQAGVDVQLLENGEILVSTRCLTAESARYVAEKFKLDHLRTGWTASE